MTSDDVSLLPCPFCGSANIDPEGWATTGGIAGPACNACQASVGSALLSTAENIAAWNRRSTDGEAVAWLWPDAGKRMQVSLNDKTMTPSKVKFLEAVPLYTIPTPIEPVAVTDDMVERAAVATCEHGGFDPYEIMANDGPRWKYYIPGARAAITAALTPKVTP